MRPAVTMLCGLLVAVPAQLVLSGELAADVKAQRVDSGGSPCIDRSEVVGRSRCNRFGSWWDVTHVPRVQLGLGMSVRMFDSALVRSSGDAAPRARLRLLEGLPADPGITALTLDIRITGRVGPLFYLGAEGSIGGAELDEPDLADGVYLGGGGVAGIAVPLGGVTLRGEAVYGARVVAVSTPTGYGFHDQDGRDVQRFFESRLAVQTWVGPWTSIGASLGSNLLAERDVSAGVFLQGHLRAFDAAFAR
jgi:hypothetical protein